MSIKVEVLPEPTKEVENYLRADIRLNGLPLYDLTLAWDTSDWFVARQHNQLIGCLIIYKGGRGMDSFFTRGSQKSVEQLVANMQYPIIYAIIPEHHREIIKEHYQFLTQGKFHLMCVEESRYTPPPLQQTIRLTSADLDEVDRFYQTTTAGAWNAVQLKIGPFYGIRAHNKLVSICGTIGVYKPSPGVSVIGNLVTLPAYQKRGYGTSVLCAVIQELFKDYQYVTLMVESDNHAAIRIYNRIGFTLYATLDIGVCQRRM